MFGDAWTRPNDKGNREEIPAWKVLLYFHLITFQDTHEKTKNFLISSHIIGLHNMLKWNFFQIKQRTEVGKSQCSVAMTKSLINGKSSDLCESRISRIWVLLILFTYHFQKFHRTVVRVWLIYFINSANEELKLIHSYSQSNRPH